MLGHSIHQSLYRPSNHTKRNFQQRASGKVVDLSVPRMMISPDVLDMIAEEKMTGGYTKKKNPICPICYTQKSISGSCCE